MSESSKTVCNVVDTYVRTYICIRVYTRLCFIQLQGGRETNDKRTATNKIARVEDKMDEMEGMAGLGYQVEMAYLATLDWWGQKVTKDHGDQKVTRQRRTSWTEG